MLHGALQPNDGPDPQPVPQAPKVAALPTARSQLDYFVGDWHVGAMQLQSVRRGDWLFVTHPAGRDGRQARFADAFSYDNGSYVRYDQTPYPTPMFVSGGWQGKHWEWQRVDCGARISYDQLDDETMVVTEEVRDPNAPGRAYRLVRLFEVRRQTPA